MCWGKLLIVPIIALIVAAPVAETDSWGQIESASRVTVDTLHKILGDKDLVIIDVRSSQDYRSSATKIRGAVREEPEKTVAWMDKYSKDKKIVLYCA